MLPEDSAAISVLVKVRGKSSVLSPVALNFSPEATVLNVPPAGASSIWKVTSVREMLAFRRITTPLISEPVGREMPVIVFVTL
jgi:hypothetical protein